MRKIVLFTCTAFIALMMTSCTKQNDVFHQTLFTTVLSPANEVPARVSDGFGDVLGVYDNDTKVLTLRIHYANLKAPLTAWHIHKAAAGVNGSVLFNFGAPAPSDFTYSTPALAPDQENDLMTGNYYVNLHSTLYPGGEIRGQLMKK